MVDGNTPATGKFDLPLELRCSLCNTVFKEAVMVPCCQHSFCEKCIHSVLVKKDQCPKCSAKCRVVDLLPNLSLRQVIEHLLKPQTLISGSDNILPDGVGSFAAGRLHLEDNYSAAMDDRYPSGTSRPSIDMELWERVSGVSKNYVKGHGTRQKFSTSNSSYSSQSSQTSPQPPQHSAADCLRAVMSDPYLLAQFSVQLSRLTAEQLAAAAAQVDRETSAQPAAAEESDPAEPCDQGTQSLG